MAIEGVVREYGLRQRLAAAGVHPTRTILLSGPPGVGKTMTIGFLAHALQRPLIRVEPTDVMNSLLGESARALAQTFTRARDTGAILALDEIDALAKRRDDVYDVGEFKRFVTTLLVELDRWPGDAPLVAATNHLDLLDPALERRFELHLRLDRPSADVRQAILEQALASLDQQPRRGTIDAIVSITHGATGADIADLVRRAVRRTILDDEQLDRALFLAAVPANGAAVDRGARTRFARVAHDQAGLTTRQIGDLLNCSHTTARRLAQTATTGAPATSDSV
jgi:SpoVK/Ycf46/Vps4 family AAA+-type ATPase